MTRSIQWNAVAYLMIAALLASLFFSFNLLTNEGSARSADMAYGFPQWHGTASAAPASRIAAPVAPDQPKSLFQPATVIPKASATVHIQTAAALKKPIAPAAAPSIRTYRVTSYYLNVRALPSADADIVREVKQDTRLDVVGATAAGWLALKGGGYVNGRYAAPIDPAATAVPEPAPAASSASSEAAKSAHAPAQAKAKSEVSAQSAAPLSASSGDPMKPSSKVMSDSGLTKAHISQLLKGTKLENQGLEDAILAVERDYGINAFFTIAVMKLESGNGKSKLAKTKNNLFGLNAVTGNAHAMAFSFATKGDSVKKFGKLINDNYVERGYTTIEKVARKYCPANGKWAGHVRTIMRGDFGKLT
ncbi:Mannosyl-glycoprotein endo-beta-N-acetylglucosaminidase [Paenibacillus sp. UNC496MF]|uniref:glucosaminidase domain-containing protein n=1 Tax=Paenibacillus sp. UNC496MF TaxID=1502753 RepID=UPI0008EEEB37|nr:glucosaminidase domain-containing protein [Paenibacillus sp. UNC496MF]SFI34951.1 Mannosyl-glycoprotein endo-beta-N-acetylglucosaminidase [Paenibacillus sp. UNC496MF]